MHQNFDVKSCRAVQSYEFMWNKSCFHNDAAIMGSWIIRFYYDWSFLHLVSLKNISVDQLNHTIVWRNLSSCIIFIAVLHQFLDLEFLNVAVKSCECMTRIVFFVKFVHLLWNSKVRKMCDLSCFLDASSTKQISTKNVLRN